MDNYPTPLGSDKIMVLIDKLKKGKYEKFKDLTFNIKGELDITYFPFSFYEKGTYKIRVYSKDQKYINTGIVEIAFK